MRKAGGRAKGLRKAFLTRPYAPGSGIRPRDALPRCAGEPPSRRTACCTDSYCCCGYTLSNINSSRGAERPRPAEGGAAAADSVGNAEAAIANVLTATTSEAWAKEGGEHCLNKNSKHVEAVL